MCDSNKMNDHTLICDMVDELCDSISKRPQKFLEANRETVETLKEQVKRCYDYSKRQEIVTSMKSDALPELMIKNFDLEQIWQQIELQNDPLLTQSLRSISNLATLNQHRLIFKNLEQEVSNHESEEELIEHEAIENADCMDQSEDGHEIDEEHNDGSPSPTRPTNHRKLSVEDDFFKLDEMERFLAAEERKTDNPDSGNDSYESEDDEESVDLFEAPLVDDEMINPRFKDFFVTKETPVNEKRNKFSDEFIDADAVPKSSHELRQDRLTARIVEIEENATSAKPWQLKGEITADGRPHNSLLEEIVEFDMSSIPAPVITEQTSYQLEDVIKQRIKNKVFDSVERKKKPTDTPLEYKKKLVLNQEKNKESLAEIYEKEYLEQQANQDGMKKEQEEPELHKEIDKMMTLLFHKLDSLSNFHFTPKPAVPELKIVSNLPAISMEEVAPVATSNAALLAPEQVKRKTKSDSIGKSERTATDKSRERRKKKLKQRVHAKINENRRNAGLRTKNDKEKSRKDKNVEKMNQNSGSRIKSSTAFFTQLQDQIRSQVNEKNVLNKQGKTKLVLDAKKIKL